MNNIDTPDAEYAFAVIKSKDGRVMVGNFDFERSDRQPTIDDVYTAIKIIERDLMTQQTVGGVLGALSQAQGNPNSNARESGLIVPEPNVAQPKSKFRKVQRAN